MGFIYLWNLLLKLTSILDNSLFVKIWFSIPNYHYLFDFVDLFIAASDIDRYSSLDLQVNVSSTIAAFVPLFIPAKLIHLP